MKNNGGDILLIFIGVSVIIHILVLYLSDIESAEPAALQNEYIPVSLEIRKEQPPFSEYDAKPEPVKEEPAPVSEPVPEPVPKPVKPDPDPTPVQPVKPETEVSAEPPEDTAEPSAQNASIAEPSPEESSTSTPSPQPAVNPFEELMQNVNELKDSVYPLRAKKRRYQGTVVVELKLDSEGYLTDAEIVQNSRYPILDNAAMHLIELVFQQPYPHHMGRDVVLKMPITFKLL